MDIVTLKQNILDNEIDDDFMVFLTSDNNFVADQYINSICERRGYQRNPIESLNEVLSATSLLFETDNYLNVLKVDTFDETGINYSELKNTIVVCSKIDKKVKPLISDYLVEIPALVDWQIKDFIKAECPALDKDTVELLYSVTNGNIYKVSNEVHKLKLFAGPEQKAMLQALIDQPGSDLYATENLSDKIRNAIIEQNKFELAKYLSYSVWPDITPIGLVNRLLTEYTNILLATKAQRVTAQTIGISEGQFRFFNRYRTGISIITLMKNIEFLSNIDTRLKSSQLDLEPSMLIKYIINNLLV